MTPMLEYVILASVGTVCGFAAHRLASSLRGTVGRQLVLRYFLEGIAITPGIALVGFFLGQRPLPPNLVRMLGLGGAFVVPRSEEHTSELQSHSDLVCRL